MRLGRDLNGDERRRVVVEGVAGICRRRGGTVIAEGVETPGKLAALRELGVTLVQAFLLAKPTFEMLYKV